MAESLQEKLNRAIDAMLAYGGSAPAASTDAELAPIARVAAELRGLPGENFRATLKADLIRKATRAGEAAETAVEPQPTVIPRLCFKDTRRAIEFYQSVFGAKETMRLVDPDQKIGIAQIQIGNARILLSDEYPEFGAISPETLGGSAVRIKLMVPDVDATAQRALAAGAKMVRPVEDQFYGERAGQIADPFGYTWIIATHKEDVSTEEMQRRLNQWSERSEEKMASNPAVSKTGSSESAKAVPYIREGFHTITPYILVNGAAKFIEFMTEAFGAQERGRVPVPSGKIMHAEVKVGDSMIELSDGNEQYPPTPAALHFYVDDADATYARAVEAGATPLYAMTDQPYGDREGGVKDPFGNIWFIATPKTYAPMPGQLGSVQPYLFLRDAEKMIPFLENAFGAKAEGVHKSPAGVVAHATVRIGDATLECSEAHGEYQPSPCHLHLYVRDADAVYAQALRAGATTIEAPSDKPYGDRSAGVKDPWGNSWFIATHIKDVAF
ncbi:MAG: VOC family protein [Candidatus Acidiferrales bacterium]